MDIGVFEIDQQHRELVRRFNQFAAAVESGSNEKAVYDMLIFMRGYCYIHFEAEEELMRQVGYPGMAAHVHEHREFIGKHFWLNESLRVGAVDIAQETAEYLENWIANHVTVEDKKIGEYICSEVQRLKNP